MLEWYIKEGEDRELCKLKGGGKNYNLCIRETEVFEGGVRNTKGGLK